MTLVGKSLEDLLIPKSSETGKKILAMWEEYQNFARNITENTVSLDEADEPAYSAQEETSISENLDAIPF